MWAAGARSDGDVYAEMTERVEQLPDTPQTQALADVIHALGRSAGDISATRQPTSEVVPEWLVDRLVHTAGMTRVDVEAMSPEAAMQTWEAFITRSVVRDALPSLRVEHVDDVVVRRVDLSRAR